MSRKVVCFDLKFENFEKKICIYNQYVRKKPIFTFVFFTLSVGKKTVCIAYLVTGMHTCNFHAYYLEDALDQ